MVVGQHPRELQVVVVLDREAVHVPDAASDLVDDARDVVAKVVVAAAAAASADAPAAAGCTAQACT